MDELIERKRSIEDRIAKLQYELNLVKDEIKNRNESN